MAPPILFMGRIFEVPWGGVREFADSLLKAAAPLCEAAGRRIDVLVPAKGLCPVASPAIREVVLPRHAGNRILWDHGTVRAHANRQRGAVLYNPKLVLPEVLRVPGFTSLYDLMYFPQPHKYDWREYLLGDSLYMRTMIRRTVRRAPAVHVISHHTARDAREIFWKDDPAKFRPIHLGVDTARWAPRAFSAEDEREWRGLEAKGLAGPFLFHAGGMSRRKNLRVLAAAFAKFVRRYPEFRLVLTGGAKPTMGDPALGRALEAIPAGKVIRLGHVSPRALELLYQRAAFFVFPSLYEGFGLPLLEAQAAGCPVICSWTTSHPEVVGESALLFDPESPAELLERMEALLFEEERARLRALGFASAATFTWEKTARAWLALADEAAGA